MCVCVCVSGQICWTTQDKMNVMPCHRDSRHCGDVRIGTYTYICLCGPFNAVDTLSLPYGRMCYTLFSIRSSPYSLHCCCSRFRFRPAIHREPIVCVDVVADTPFR